MKITGEVLVPACPVFERPVIAEVREEYTDPSGLRRAQYKSVTGVNDYSEGLTVRYSDDNGRTWGAWQDAYKDYSFKSPDGAYEIVNTVFGPEIYNPVHKHHLVVKLQQVCVENHQAAIVREWCGEKTVSAHNYLLVRAAGSESTEILPKYEPGPDFDPGDPLSAGYFHTNTSTDAFPSIMENGDVLLPAAPYISKCCKVLGIDPGKAFTGAEFKGLVLGRGKWNGKSYDFSWSNPVILTDRQSSRGVCEPLAAELKGGRILCVARGSNQRHAAWGRMEPGTPGFKWYCFSDDGGKTLSPFMPWHFDDGKVIYSSSSISKFIRSQKTGKLYWVGNVTGHKIDGNNPRYPLQIAEVDEKYGFLVRRSLTVIDTRRKGETSGVQLSNFILTEDRETGDIEVYLSKICQFKGSPFRGEAWRYRVVPE